jgi:NAD(P)-dependent dehydrogenase (short-subunit alcohol dehydrogenase family)
LPAFADVTSEVSPPAFVEAGFAPTFHGLHASAVTDRKTLRETNHEQRHPHGEHRRCLQQHRHRAGFLNTLQPSGQIGKTRDIVDAVLYLTDAPFTTGAVLTVDGGAAAGKW